MERCPADLQILEEFEAKRIQEKKKEQAVLDKAAKAKEAERMKALKAAGQLPEKKKDGDKKKDKKKSNGASWRDLPLRARLSKIIESQFKRITYTEAIALLEKAVEEGAKTFEEPVSWGIDMSSEHEKYLCEEVFQRPTVVTDYPKDIKAFYMRMNPDGKTVAAMDILVPGVGELCGGSQREERYDVLVARMDEMGLKPEDYSWYLDLRKYGSVPHSGFGAGFERLVCYTTGMDNIRDVIPFPRYPGHAEY